MSSSPPPAIFEGTYLGEGWVVPLTQITHTPNLIPPAIVGTATWTLHLLEEKFEGILPLERVKVVIFGDGSTHAQRL